MTKIEICEKKNAAVINEMLEKVNGRASQHTYNNYLHIVALAEQAENRLLGIVAFKKNCQGAKFYATSGGSVPKSYRNSRRATSVGMYRGSKSWYLVSVYATVIFHDGGDKCLCVPRRNYEVGEANRLYQLDVKIFDETRATAA